MHVGIPLEHAAILFRYSRNFAETGVISYNLKSPAIEGATDNLYMNFVAGLIKAGNPDCLGALIINLASLLLIILLLRDLFSLSFWETTAALMSSGSTMDRFRYYAANLVPLKLSARVRHLAGADRGRLAGAEFKGRSHRSVGAELRRVRPRPG